MGLTVYTPGMNGGADQLQQGRDAHCIVWRAKGCGLPEPLTAALDRPDVQVTTCDNEFEALARVCGAARSQERAAVLLFVEPAQLTGPGELADLAARLAPAAAMWVYDGASSPQLRALTPADRA